MIGDKPILALTIGLKTTNNSPQSKAVMTYQKSFEDDYLGDKILIVPTKTAEKLFYESKLGYFEVAHS